MVTVRDADISSLNLLGSRIVGLEATGVRVRGDISLSNDFKCRGSVILLGARLGGCLNCDGGHIYGPKNVSLVAERISVEGSIFLRDGFVAKGTVMLLGATIRGDLSCVKGSIFSPDERVDPDERATADKRALSGEAMTIGGNLFLSDGFMCQGIVNLAGTTVSRSFVWRKVKEPENTQWQLHWVTVGTLVDDKASWPLRGRLFLNGFIYQDIGSEGLLDVESRIEWVRLQGRKRFLPQPYEQLAAVLRKNGYAEEATEVLIAKNRDRARLTRVFSSSWWWYRVFGRIIEYGYRPWRAFVGSVMIILIGTVLFSAGYRDHLMSPAKENAYIQTGAGSERRLAEDYQPFSPLIYSLEAFVPLIKLGQVDAWQPNVNAGARVKVSQVSLAKTGDLLRRYLWFHIVIGWLLTTLWVGGLTGLVKT